MKTFWSKAVIGTAVIVAVGGATVVGASALNETKEPKVNAEEALNAVFHSVDGVINEVQLTLDDNQYEIEVESAGGDYEFWVDATSGKFIEETVTTSEEDQDEEVASSVDASGYIEFDTIQKQITAEGLEFHLVTDNPGKRILLLIDESGVKHYKTIFIKSQNVLEIVDVLGGGQVYRGDI